LVIYVGPELLDADAYVLQSQFVASIVGPKLFGVDALCSSHNLLLLSFIFMCVACLYIYIFKNVLADVISSMVRVCTAGYMATGAYDLIILQQLNALVRFGNGETKQSTMEDSFINYFILLKLMWRFGNRVMKQALRQQLAKKKKETLIVLHLIARNGERPKNGSCWRSSSLHLLRSCKRSARRLLWRPWVGTWLLAGVYDARAGIDLACTAASKTCSYVTISPAGGLRCGGPAQVDRRGGPSSLGCR
jgi:hypothetical protein